MQPKTHYNRRRDTDPAVTLFWIAAPTETRPVPLNGLNCIFCKTTIFDHMTGTIESILNAPVNIDDYALSGTVRCKLCKQNYRLVVAESYQM